MSKRHLTILQLNDLYGYLEPHPEVFRGRGRFNYRACGGLARIASIFKRVRAEHHCEALALDNGGTFHSTFVACQSRGEPERPPDRRPAGRRCAGPAGPHLRAAMLGEQGVPMKYCSQLQLIGVDAIQSLPQLFTRDTQVRVGRCGIVVAV